ncbi:MAG: hypothetical protein D3923_04215 [Candidatus Electrothrix sp. AR3]|nr:hypothetical protein [Candidatus Electrothrix sp. AR3]
MKLQVILDLVQCHIIKLVLRYFMNQKKELGRFSACNRKYSYKYRAIAQIYSGSKIFMFVIL